MNKMVKKALAAALALTIVGGGLPALTGGADIFKPSIVANAGSNVKKIGVGVTLNFGETFDGTINDYGNACCAFDYINNPTTPNGQTFNADGFDSWTSLCTRYDNDRQMWLICDARPDVVGFVYGGLNPIAERNFEEPTGIRVVSGNGKASDPFQFELVYEGEPKQLETDVAIGKKWYIGDEISTDAYFSTKIGLVNITQYTYYLDSDNNSQTYNWLGTSSNKVIHLKNTTLSAGDFYVLNNGNAYLYFNDVSTGIFSEYEDGFDRRFTKELGFEVSAVNINNLNFTGSGTSSDPFVFTAGSMHGTAQNVAGIEIVGGSGTKADPFTIAPIIEGQSYVDIIEANEVINKINAIGTVEYTEACLTKINAARSAYNALTANQKALVTNYTTLTSAETTYTTLAAEPQNIVAAAGVTVNNGDYLCSFYNNTGLLQDEYDIYFSDSNGHIHETCAGYNLTGEDNRILVDFNNEGFLSESSSWTFFSVLHSQNEMINPPSPSFTISAPADRALETPDGLKIISGDGTKSNPFKFKLVYSNEPKPAYENVTVGKKWLIGDTINTDAYFKVDVPILGDYNDIYSQEKTLQFLRKPLSTCVKSNYDPYGSFYTGERKSFIEFNDITAGAFDYHYMAEQYEFYSNILLEGDVNLVKGIEVTGGSGTKADPFTIAPIVADPVSFTENPTSTTVNPANKSLYVKVSYAFSVNEGYTSANEYGFLYCNDGTITDPSQLTLEAAKTNSSIQIKTGKTGTNFRDYGKGVVAVGYVKVKNSVGAEEVAYTGDLGGRAVIITENAPVTRINSANKQLYVGVSYAIQAVGEFTTEGYGILYCNDGTITDPSMLTLEAAETNSSIQKKAGKTGTNLLDKGKGVVAVGYNVVKNAKGQEAVIYTGNVGGQAINITENAPVIRVNDANKQLYVGISYAITPAAGLTVSDYGILYCNDGTITDPSQMTLEAAETNSSIQKKAGKTGTNFRDYGKGVVAVGYNVVTNSEGKEAVVYTGDIGGRAVIIKENPPVPRTNNGKNYVGVSYSIQALGEFTTEGYGILYCNDGTITDPSMLTLEAADTNASIQKKEDKTGTNLLDTGKGVVAVGYNVVKNSKNQEAIIYTDNIGGKYADLT